MEFSTLPNLSPQLPRAVFAKMPSKPQINESLHNAVSAEKIEEIKTIINSNINNIDNLDNKGMTPLLLALHRGNVTIITLLINSGANINWTDSKGDSYLHYCVSYSKYECLDFLLSKG